MSLLADTFSADAFNFLNLTTALQKLPFQSRRIGELNLFNKTEGVETGSVVIDETAGRLQILSTSLRGSPAQQSKKPTKAKARSVAIPHITTEDRILAASLFGKRQPGENELQSVVRQVNDSQAQIRKDIEDTWEVHRLNALKGILLDADATVIENFFTLFGVAQQTHNFVLSVATTDVRGQTIKAKRKIESELGGVPYSGARMLCGADFFDAYVGHANVKATYQLAEAQQTRNDLRYSGWMFGGVTIEEYRGNGTAVGSIAADEAVMFPEGVPDMCRVYYAPGDFLEAVGTLGMPMYSKAAPDLQYNRWVDIMGETNPLHINTRPRAVLKVTMT